MQDDAGGTSESLELKGAESKKKSGAKGLSISWTASEAIDHERGTWWYVIAITVAIIAVGLSFWLQGVSFNSISSTILIVVVFAAILTVSRRPARELHYTLSSEGLTIDGKLRSFDEFRAFGVAQDGALWQLVLIPVQRFGFSITMLISSDQGEAIVDALGARLPMENVKIDLLDKIIRKLKI